MRYIRVQSVFFLDYYCKSSTFLMIATGMVDEVYSRERIVETNFRPYCCA